MNIEAPLWTETYAVHYEWRGMVALCSPAFVRAISAKQAKRTFERARKGWVSQPKVVKVERASA
jgi:hypothetical protein